MAGTAFQSLPVMLLLNWAADYSTHYWPGGLAGEWGLPLCFLEPAWLDVEILAELPAPNPAPGFEKPTACNDCALFDRCVGVRSHYAELHGVDEVTPHTRPPADFDGEHLLVRTALCLEGTVELELICEPDFDYGRVPAAWKMVAMLVEGVIG